MKKSVLVTISLLMALTFILSACGAGASSAKAPADNASTQAPADNTAAAATTDSGGAGGAKTPILFWFPHGSDPDKTTLENMVKDFNAKYPQYNATAEYIGSSGAGVGMTDKLMTAIAGGNAPDVVLFDRFMVGQWASEGLFTDISAEAAAASVTKDLFYDFAWKEASLNGKLYAMPFDTDDRALYCNMDLLGAAGFEPPKTIADLDKIADALTKKEGNRFIQIGIVPWFSQGFLYTWAGAFGAKFQDEATGKITFDDPKAVQALEWMVTYADKFGMEAITDFTNAASGGDINPFAAGMFAMMVSGPWEVSGLKTRAPDMKYTIVSVPTPDGHVAATMAGGWSMVVPMGRKDLKAAFALAKYMTTEEGATRYGEETTHFMTLKSVNDNLSWVKNDPLFDVFVKGFPNAFCRPVIPKGQLLWDEQMTAQNNALNHVDTPANLLKAMTAKVNAELGF